MSAYENQHYLPAAYLKQFAADKSAKPTRKSQIWRFDGRTSKPVPVEDQCCERWFYSKEYAATIEKAFGAGEGCFAECARRIRDGKPPADGQFSGLIAIIFDLHLRNAAHDNLTGKNNFCAYQLRLCGLKKRLVGKENEPSEEEFLLHINDRWRVRVLRASDGNEFVTSDNPSILMKDWHYALLPTTPFHVAIAYDCNHIKVTGTHTSVADEDLLNKLQLSNATKCVYSSVPLNEAQETYATERLNRKSRLRSRTDDESWTPVMRTLAPSVKFSFWV
jgi:hypothetical protein